MKTKKFYKRLLTVVLYFDKEHLFKQLQLHDDAKKTNKGIAEVIKMRR